MIMDSGISEDMQVWQNKYMRNENSTFRHKIEIEIQIESKALPK